MTRREVKIPVGRGGTVSGVVLEPHDPLPATFLLGHGAGGDLHTPVLASVAHGLAADGFRVLRYNFRFSEAGRRRPDFPRVLQVTAAGAVRWAEAELGARDLILGGKSLGGRMASHIVADGVVQASGLVFLGYPLHPPRRPAELRDAHLSRIGCPMLFVEGTRDPYADLGLLRQVVERLSNAGLNADVHVVDGGDHDFKVPVRMRRPYEHIVSEVTSAVSRWAHSISQISR